MKALGGSGDMRGVIEFVRGLGRGGWVALLMVFVWFVLAMVVGLEVGRRWFEVLI
jgi:hypothetical protein